MSDQIKHECGIALIRLLKPLEYYLANYGTSFYGLQKLHLLMQKQHNRGQDGAGIAGIKLFVEPGQEYISRIRSNSSTPMKDIFNQVYDAFQEVKEKYPARLNDVQWLKKIMDLPVKCFWGICDTEPMEPTAF